MKISVRYIGIYRDIAGVLSEDLDVPTAAEVADLVAILIQRYPDLAPFAADLRILRNGTGVGRTEKLGLGDEIVLVDPISGGSTSEVRPSADSTRIRTDAPRCGSAHRLHRGRRGSGWDEP